FHSGVDLAVAHAGGVRGARVVDRHQHRALLRHRVHRADRCTMGAEELNSRQLLCIVSLPRENTSPEKIRCQGGRFRMFGTPKAIRRLVAGTVIASTILLRPGTSRALDNVTLITDFGYNGRHAYFFVAVDKGYYRDAGLEVKIVRGQGGADAIRQVGAGNA